jgi:hypothetical protein
MMRRKLAFVMTYWGAESTLLLYSKTIVYLVRKEAVDKVGYDKESIIIM